MFSKFLLGSPNSKSNQNEQNDSIDIDIVSIKLVCSDNVQIQSTRVVGQTFNGSQLKGPAFETRRVTDYITVGTIATKVWTIKESCLIYPKDIAIKASFQIIGTINNLVDMVIAETNVPITLASIISSRSTEIELPINREITDVLNSITCKSDSSSPIFKAFVSLRVRLCQRKSDSPSSSSGSSGSSPPRYLQCVSTVDESRVGTLTVKILEGKRFNTICPCYVNVSLLHTRSQFGHRSLSPSNPHAPIFDYAVVLDLPSFQCDALFEVFEESFSGPNLLGQVIFPVQWLLPLTLNGPRRFRTEPTWLEVFPPMPPTLFNNGGKYRPHMKGLPHSTGYGLPSSEKAVGFLYAELELELTEPLVNTLLRDPWKYSAAADDSDSVPAQVCVYSSIIHCTRIVNNYLVSHSVYRSLILYIYHE